MEYNKVELTQELSNNCIEYAAAVNEDRAIPDATSELSMAHMIRAEAPISLMLSARILSVM